MYTKMRNSHKIKICIQVMEGAVTQSKEILSASEARVHNRELTCRHSVAFSFALQSSRRHLLQGVGSDCALSQYNSSSGSYSNATFSACSSPAVTFPPLSPFPLSKSSAILAS